MEFIPVRVSTFRGDQKTNFDVYIRIGQKNILYIRQGDSFEGDRLKRLKEKKLKKMYITPSDEQNYRIYLEKNIEMAYDANSGTPLQTRAEIIQGQQQANAEEVMENPSDVAAYNDAKQDAGKYVNFLLNETAGLKAMLLIENTDQNLAHHSVTVSTLAVGLASRLGLKDENQLQILTLGGLLHDIGHVNAPYDVTRPLADFTPDELSVYKQHPQLGGAIADDKSHFDPGVVKIIKQHHEHVDGSGFPGKLIEKKTDPLAVITSACESLERLLVYDGLKRSDAVRKLMIDKVGAHPLNYIQHLQSLLKDLDN